MAPRKTHSALKLLDAAMERIKASSPQPSPVIPAGIVASLCGHGSVGAVPGHGGHLGVHDPPGDTSVTRGVVLHRFKTMVGKASDQVVRCGL